MADDPLASARDRNGALIKALIVPYALLGTAVLLFVPEGVPIVRSLTAWAGTWIPSMDRYAAVSPFPDAARLFILVMSIGFPFVAYRLARNWTFPDRMFELRRFDQWFVVGAAIVVALLAGFFVWVFIDVPRENILAAGGRGGAFARLLTQYRLGMALIGSVLFGAAAAATGAALCLAGQIIRRGRGWS